MLSYCHSLVTQFATIETAYEVFLMKLQGKVRVSFERPDDAWPAPPGWRSHPKSGANSQPNWCSFASLGKELSGAENRFELSLLFVEKLGFEKCFAIFCHFFNFSVYCRGSTDKAGKFFIQAFSMKMSSTFKNRQVRTFGGFLLRFSSLL